MKARDIKVGGLYYANVSGRRVVVKVIRELPPGGRMKGWMVTNLRTGRDLHFPTAGRFHGMLTGHVDVTNRAELVAHLIARHRPQSHVSDSELMGRLAHRSDESLIALHKKVHREGIES